MKPTTQFVSNDKSKSFYSSEIENNTLLDNNNLGFDEHSNSSNFFSNIDASNSQIQLDDSAIASNHNALCANFQAPDTAVKALYQAMNMEKKRPVQVSTRAPSQKSSIPRVEQ